MYVFYSLTDLKICYFPKNLFPKGYNNLHCQHIQALDGMLSALNFCHSEAVKWYVVALVYISSTSN